MATYHGIRRKAKTIAQETTNKEIKALANLVLELNKKCEEAQNAAEEAERLARRG